MRGATLTREETNVDQTNIPTKVYKARIEP